jgi:hypothetical protein
VEGDSDEIEETEGGGRLPRKRISMCFPRKKQYRRYIQTTCTRCSATHADTGEEGGGARAPGPEPALIAETTLGAGAGFPLRLLDADDGTSEETALLLVLTHAADPTTIKSQINRTSLKEKDSMIPVGRGVGAGLGNFSSGRGRHNGRPVCASMGTSQRVDLGYGCLIIL